MSTDSPTPPLESEEINYQPETLMARRKRLQDFMRNHMVEGIDYGLVPGVGKPFLFKPGAEAIAAAFGMAPDIEVTQRIEDWEIGFLSYEVKVLLHSKVNQSREGAGVGSCNSRERKYKSKDAADVANTILKMAKKRAYVDAVLTATGASSMFTQDEDYMEIENAHVAKEASDTRYAQRPVGGTGGRPAPARNNLRPGTLTIPFGNCKDKSIPELSDRDLEYYRGVFFKSVSEGKYVERNQALIDAIDAEQAARAQGEFDETLPR